MADAIHELTRKNLSALALKDVDSGAPFLLLLLPLDVASIILLYSFYSK